jgi:hypothetical protein
MKKVVLKPIDETVKILASKCGKESAEPYIVDFRESLPDDRVVEIDECDLWLSDCGNYYGISEAMIERNIA